MHYHAYSYEGPGEAIKPFDGARRAGGVGFDTAAVPPVRTDWWLCRPARAIRATWDDPREGVSWLTAQWREKVDGHEIHPRQQRRPHLDFMAALSLEQLSMGNDEVWASWLSGGMYAHFAVICCPNRTVGGPPCPIGREDTRPEGATRYVG